MEISKIPVFDIGDTLMPSFRLQNELMKDELDEYGAEEIPEFDVNNFRIYTPSEVREYMEKHGIDHNDPLRIIEKYKERERKFMEERNVFRMLKKISKEFGPIGFISDNTIEGKNWLETLLKAHGVPYQGFVVSEEVGVEKPDPQIFRKFFDYRTEPAGEFVYIGNNAKRDPACRKVGMDFVLSREFKVYGEPNRYRTIDRTTFETVKQVVTE